MLNSELIDLAKALAHVVHNGHTRKSQNDCQKVPYVSHALAVGQILTDYSRSAEEIIAGILHDTIEESGGNRKNIELVIEELFGYKILKIIQYCSQISNKENGSRADRVKIDIYHYVSGSAASHNVKIADAIHNLSDLSSLDRKFAKVYLNEKFAMASEFRKSGKCNGSMLNDLFALIKAQQSKLE